jgi:hypothetical protein
MHSQSPQEYFRAILLTVVGQAFGAAGYPLEDRPLRWANGLFRFINPLEPNMQAIIEFQHLAYAQGNPSRFTVFLERKALGPSSVLPAVRLSLSHLVVGEFGVAILPDVDYWWTFHSTAQLGSALAEAGHLAVAYGMPWLSGDLLPPSG